MPALVLIPVLVVLPRLVHGGGWELVGQFALAAEQPCLDPVVIQSVLSGLGTTVSTPPWSTMLLSARRSFNPSSASAARYS